MKRRDPASVSALVLEALEANAPVLASFRRLGKRLEPAEQDDLATLLALVVSARVFGEIKAGNIFSAKQRSTPATFDLATELGLSRSELESVPKTITDLSEKISEVQQSALWVADAATRDDPAAFEGLPDLLRAFGRRLVWISAAIPKRRYQSEYRHSLYRLFGALDAIQGSTLVRGQCQYANDLSKVLNLLFERELKQAGFRWKTGSDEDFRFSRETINEAYRRFRQGPRDGRPIR